MELPGLSAVVRAKLALLVALVLTAALVVAVGAGSARAATTVTTTVTVSGSPVLVTSQTTPPKGFRLELPA